MQLTLFTDYALRVLIHAAVHRERRCTTEEFATAFKLSRHHVVKVVNQLQHLGYLQTERGRAGGFRLAQPPEDICIGAVVRQTEGSLAIVECFGPAPSKCPLAGGCGLKGAVHEAFDAFFAVLDRYRLSDFARPEWAGRVISLLPLQPPPIVHDQTHA